MNGALRGEARFCAASLRAPLPAAASPRPAYPDPCCRGAETRRPLRTRTRTTQGQRRTRAEGAAVRGARWDARELAGREWHRAPRGQGWVGRCTLAGRVCGWAERTGSLRPEGDSGAGASPPGTELPAAGSAGSRRSDSGTRTGRRRAGFLGRTGSLGPAGSSCSREGPSERPCRLSAKSPVLSLTFIPPSPHFMSSYLLCEFLVILLGLLMGQARLLEAGQPCRKENKSGAE